MQFILLCMACEGDGSCLSLCECSYLKGTNDCHCLSYKHEHFKSNNKRFCKIEKCKYKCVLKDCKTINYCKESYPEWCMKGEQCNYCSIYSVKFINKKDNCDICFIDKYLIETDCKHQFCLDCLIQMNGKEDENPDSPCPFCKRSIKHNYL